MSNSSTHRFRPRWRPSLIHGALLASLLLHLSMVTLFKIVIYFPRRDLEYLDFHIVAAAGEPAPLAPPESGGLPALFPVLGQGLTLGGTLPDIELPTMAFGELRRLRLGNAGNEPGFDRIYDGEPLDSWARFTRSLQGVGERLAELRLSGTNETLPGSDTDDTTKIRPAAGIVGEIDWERSGTARALLFAPPMHILDARDVAELPLPIEVVFQVNAIGRIVDTFSPTVDPQGIVEEIQFTLLQYRFEPLPPGDERTRPETATLVLRAVEEAP
ncbi:MAG: hypothetical protein HYV27_10190 [Candidatus Hydrogenedentes bacterium]|nr:hypothetical protein [Candidatus Hydrogenedentota bacterium]